MAKYKKPKNYEKYFLGSMLNQGVTGISQLVGADPDNPVSQILGSTLGAVGDFATGNIAGGAMNSLDFLSDIKNTMKNGGEMYQNGGLTEYQSGGTHQENPNGGIPIGQNLVEEGETRSGDFVFSDRLKINKTLAEEFSLPKKLIGKTFAEASKEFEDSERPNDIYSERGNEREINNLMLAQEMFKQEEGISTEGKQMPHGGRIAGNFFGSPEFQDSYNFLQTLPQGQYSQGANVTPGRPQESTVNLPNKSLPNVYDTSVNRNNYINETSFQQKTSQAGPSNSPSGFNSTSLRYAPVLGDLISTGMIMDNKPSPTDLNKFNIPNSAEANLVDREQIERDITSQGRAVEGSLRSATGGNAGAYVSNLLGSQLQTQKAVGQANLQSDQLDQREFARVQEMDRQRDMFNQQSRMNIKNMNDADIANYRSMLMDSISNTFQNLGNIGQDEVNRKLMEEMPIDYLLDRGFNLNYEQ